MGESEPPWAATNRIMIRAEFSPDRVRRAQIWAARDRKCSRCKAPPGVACRNLVGIQKFGFDMAKENKFPHSDRIDFGKLEKQLHRMGYT